jgi:tol-pal system protein YbgF
MRQTFTDLISFRRLTAVALVAGVAVAAVPAQAQSTRELNDRLLRVEQQMMRGSGSEETANLQARVIKLEQLVEQLTGQLEEARFRNGQLTKQLEQLSNDMNYRVAVLEQAAGGQGVAPGQAIPNTPPPPQQQQRPTQQPRQLQGDQLPEYDPNAPLSRPLATPPSARPSAPTASANPVTAGPPPMTDGSVRASTPGDNTFGSLRTDAQGRALAADPNEAAIAQQQARQAPQLTPPPSQPAPMRAPAPGAVAGSQLGVGGGEGTAKLPDGTPKAQYDYAFDFLKRQDYPNAESTLREFLKKYPKDPLAGNAQYWLGETHYVRGDYQKAAVEFMNGYQNYPKSNKAPDNLLKLGMSLANIGQTQGACTALGRLNKEYPDAGDQIRRSVQQERTKLKCP